MKIYKVTFRTGIVESVFLISADNQTDAKRLVRDEMEPIGGSMSAIEASFETPYRLYSVDKVTGVIT